MIIFSLSQVKYESLKPGQYFIFLYDHKNALQPRIRTEFGHVSPDGVDSSVPDDRIVQPITPVEHAKLLLMGTEFEVHSREALEKLKEWASSLHKTWYEHWETATYLFEAIPAPSDLKNRKFAQGRWSTIDMLFEKLDELGIIRKTS